MAELSFVTTLAYDWKFAFDAIRSYYAIADEIILGLDADRISWSNKPFPFDDKAVANFIAKIDTDKKIRIVEGNFHAHVVAMENETAERRQLGAACRASNWVVQIDADEILLNPLEWKSHLNGLAQDTRVYANWIPVYKIIGNKALVVGGSPEAAPVATRSPHRYLYARITDQPFVILPLFMLHLCWCRTEEELLQKLTNWSHSHQIDIDKTVGLWRNTNLDNYHRLRNFHPLYAPLWQFLKVIDWPPKALLDAQLTRQLVNEMISLNTSDNRMVVQGKTTGGGMLISFGKT